MASICVPSGQKRLDNQVDLATVGSLTEIGNAFNNGSHLENLAQNDSLRLQSILALHMKNALRSTLALLPSNQIDVVFWEGM
jgi:hypothetical protein